MCITVSSRAGFCNCTRLLLDKTIVRLCDVALMNNRTPCKMVSFPPPDQALTDPVCLRCASAGHIAVFVSASVTGGTCRGGQDEYHIKDVYAELEVQLIAALESSLPSDTLPTHVHDKALIGILKDATSFVRIEYEDAEEQFDEDGAPLPSPDSDDYLDKFLGHSPSPVKLDTGFGRALGHLISGR